MHRALEWGGWRTISFWPYLSLFSFHKKYKKWQIISKDVFNYHYVFIRDNVRKILMNVFKRLEPILQIYKSNVNVKKQKILISTEIESLVESLFFEESEE